MSNGHLNVYSSSGQMDISKCPSDIWICPLVQWTNGHIEMSIGHLNVQSSNGRMDMSNASITCKHISAWVPHLSIDKRHYQHYQALSYLVLNINNVHWTYKIVHSTIGRTEMSIGHS